MDYKILEYIQNTMRHDIDDYIMPLISMIAENGYWMIILGIIFFAFKKTRIYSFYLGGSFIYAVLITKVILKPLIDRVRPCAEYALYYKQQFPTGVCPEGGSFPSGHVTMAFAGAVTIYLINRKWGIFTILLASFVAFSRMYMFEHYLTDVIGGAIFGAIAAILGYLTIHFIYAKIKNKKFKKLVPMNSQPKTLKEQKKSNPIGKKKSSKKQVKRKNK